MLKSGKSTISTAFATHTIQKLEFARIQIWQINQFNHCLRQAPTVFSLDWIDPATLQTPLTRIWSSAYSLRVPRVTCSFVVFCCSSCNRTSGIECRNVTDSPFHRIWFRSLSYILSSKYPSNCKTRFCFWSNIDVKEGEWGQ